MDFFDHQDRARRKTGQLILLFAFGVAATLVAVNLICFIGFWFFYQPESVSHSIDTRQLPSLFQTLLNGQDFRVTSKNNDFLTLWRAWWGSNLNWQVSIGVVAAVGIGTLFRFLELAGGGRKVAEWAGAQPADMTSKDPKVRQFINVCEEMAIAAGMPVPELFVMEREQGINAFVAGYSPAEAVLVVTRGALNRLNRDQLQGVIGHEYSHILNGDMRLNVRLMSFLAGLVMIGQMGMWLMESSFGSRRHYYGRDSSRGMGFASFGVGLVLAAVGYIGVLVGRMIKAAVSRQREFLADASSVQFTRNPDGLAGALYEIKISSEGSQLGHRHAEDMSHFCFGETVALSDKLATHPPVAERIRRISPNYIAKERTRRRQTETAEQSVSRNRPDMFESVLASTGIAAMVGQVTPDHLQYAQGLYKHIPEQLKNWVHQSDGAKAFIYSQILLGSEGVRQALVNLIKQEDPQVVATLQKLWPYSQQVDEQLRLPLLEMAIPTLKRLPEADRVILLDRLDRMVILDGRVDFVEWVTMTLLRLRLAQNPVDRSGKLNSNIANFAQSLRILFASIARFTPDQVLAEQGYAQVCQQLGIEEEGSGWPVRVAYEQLSEALAELSGISFMWRKVILQACADLIQQDGHIAFREYELLRIVAECLESPLPVLMVSLEAHDPRDELIPFE